MRRALKAAGLSAVTIGTLLPIALTTLHVWKWRMYAQLPSQQGAVVPTFTPPSLSEAAALCARLFLPCCILGVIWAAAIILPSILVARRLLPTPMLQRVLPATVVLVVSAVAFAWTQTPTESLPSILVFSIGGAIGLAGTGVAAWILPPNTSLERTREG